MNSLRHTHLKTFGNPVLGNLILSTILEKQTVGMSSLHGFDIKLIVNGHIDTCPILQ